MSFPVVDGLRTLELGSPGEMRTRLNALVLSGRKVAAFGHPLDYATENEPFEAVGEQLVLVDDTGRRVGLVEVTESVPVLAGEVGWGMVEAEGEGDRTVSEWFEGHRAYWEPLGYPLTPRTQLRWTRFRLIEPTPLVHRPTAGDLGLPEGFRHEYSGKVRDLFRSPDDQLLFIASDRISAYDHVLPTPIPDKGAVLTAMSLWWFEQLADLVPNHVLSLDVPAGVAGRAMICRPLDMLPVECVVRGYLTGSGLVDYRAGGAVCGHVLPPGLVDADRLPRPLFTPATKAALGDHDENVDFAAVVSAVGRADAEALRSASLAVYARAARTAAERGIILADTKFEFGRPMGAGPQAPIVLADEVLTPDSSRFWPAEHWRPGRAQPSFDKQFVRDWLTSPASGWDRTGSDPPPPLPDAVVEQTRQRYLTAYHRLTGRDWAAGNGT